MSVLLYVTVSVCQVRWMPAVSMYGGWQRLARGGQEAVHGGDAQGELPVHCHLAVLLRAMLPVGMVSVLISGVLYGTMWCVKCLGVAAVSMGGGSAKPVVENQEVVHRGDARGELPLLSRHASRLPLTHNFTGCVCEQVHEIRRTHTRTPTDTTAAANTRLDWARV